MISTKVYLCLEGVYLPLILETKTRRGEGATSDMRSGISIHTQEVSGIMERVHPQY